MAKRSPSDEGTATLGGFTAFESRLLNLLALRLVSERQQAEQIDLLTRAGFRPIEIAALLDTSSNNVSVRLNEMRKAKKAGKPKGTRKK
ncbi:MAG: hypothetical protein KF768_14275 [Phycisphaeraceae bacterium]|nr:hypothetical protein [Phycisphaeraceae bacterium]